MFVQMQPTKMETSHNIKKENDKTRRYSKNQRNMFYYKLRKYITDNAY